ncbi:transketolase family protein [Christensenella timonensis]|uniref:transketolase family protein n=1 Tax=Christensenella timonensis TaxID=1816678 RepID=UPI000833C058|nr:transketolase C-terminal domain-containing protein [Christensenella timonensis]
MYEKKEMRMVMSDFLAQKMSEDTRYITIDADLARASGTLALQEKFPERALDVGIAESNMACIAAGLSSYGFKPFIFSFCPFVTRRICDQVAVSIAYAKQDVKIIGTDPGICAELNGGTHMSVEDVGVMRSIPSMVIFEPVDADQLAKALPQIFAYEGPLYLRLFRKAAPQTFFADDGYQFDLFKADMLREGSDVTLFASGIEVKEAMQAADILKQEGIAAEVINVHTIKPLDEETVLQSVRKTKCAVSCENHNVKGGLGSSIAEALSRAFPVPMEYIGLQDHFSEVGKMPYLLEAFQMGAEHIAAAARKAVSRK